MRCALLLQLVSFSALAGTTSASLLVTVTVIRLRRSLRSRLSRAGW